MYLYFADWDYISSRLGPIQLSEPIASQARVCHEQEPILLVQGKVRRYATMHDTIQKAISHEWNKKVKKALSKEYDIFFLMGLFVQLKAVVMAAMTISALPPALFLTRNQMTAAIAFAAAVSRLDSAVPVVDPKGRVQRQLHGQLQ